MIFGFWKSDQLGEKKKYVNIFGKFAKFLAKR